MTTRAAIGDAALVAVGVAACVFGLRQGVGAINAPESGLMPFIVGALLAALGLPGAFARAADGHGEADGDDTPFVRNPRGWLLTVAAVIGLAVGVAYLSFVPAVFLFTLVLYAAGGSRRIVASLVYPALVTLACWLVFVHWFGVSFR